MKLKVLVDNNTIIDSYFLGEPGVSYYIEDEGKSILFDTGYSNAFMLNAKEMGIDLERVKKIIISHGHDDHTKGLKYFIKDKKNLEVIAHPACFNYKEDSEGIFIGSPLTQDELANFTNLNLSEKPIKISKNITFLGRIPETFDFEKRYSIGKTEVEGKLIEDTLIDDSAICYESKKGLVIITGCSHSGICNIIEYAKKVTGNNHVYCVIGGFHLMEVNDRLMHTIEYLKKNNIENLYPCHCVSLKAKIEMGHELDIKEVGVGLTLDL